MKRILSIMLCFVMICSTMSVFAATQVTLNTVTVGYPAPNATESNEISVSGTNANANSSLVLRVFDGSGKLLYITNTEAKNDGVFEFEKFKLGNPDVTQMTAGTATTSGNTTTTPYTGSYEFVISDATGILNENNTAVTVNYSTSVTTGGNTGGGGVVTKPEPSNICEKCGWETCRCNEPEDTPIDEGGKAYNPTENYPIIEEAAKVGSANDAKKFIETVTKATSTEAMGGEAARNTIAISVETMMANIGSKKISTSSSTNKLVLKESSISDTDLKKYTDTEKTLNDAINKNKITLNRELSKEYIVNTTFSTAKKANITIYKGFVTKLEKVGIETLTINDKNFRVSYSMTELKDMIGDKEFTSFDIDTTAMKGSTKKLTVNFDTDKTQSVKISFPGLSSDAKYMAIVDENGNPIGGRYNPATGAIEAKISESGVYQIVNNEKDFEDIKHLSEEMQDSIKILAAKGIIEGTSAKEFSPEDSISRAEVAALLLRVLSQVDPNADGGFADVKKSDWFYGTAGSAKAYGMILGFEDNTFRGNVTIAKDQILAIASRVLQREMKYITPEKPEEWLTFADASSIADWAEKDIALTTMANIITRTADNTIHADEDMTRGDAALIIMRLFYKIW